MVNWGKCKNCGHDINWDKDGIMHAAETFDTPPQCAEKVTVGGWSRKCECTKPERS